MNANPEEMMEPRNVIEFRGGKINQQTRLLLLVLVAKEMGEKPRGCGFYKGKLKKKTL